jgi:peroxiredoxin
VLTSHASKRLEAGARVAQRQLETVTGEVVVVPDPGRLVHLQFRRFAGCPVCHLHLRSFVQRHDEIEAAGIREVVMFHAPADELRPYTVDLPFAVVGDPEKQLYAEFGVESSPRALLDPRAWLGIVRSVLHALWGAIREGRPVPPSSPSGGRLGLPADFLIASDGRVLACYYGGHADDQWSVDELLRLVRRRASASRCAAEHVKGAAGGPGEL